jgi:hypothetical protein
MQNLLPGGGLSVLPQRRNRRPLNSRAVRRQLAMIVQDQPANEFVISKLDVLPPSSSIFHESFPVM